MQGIEIECARFISAILDGMAVASTYLSLHILREIIPHKLWVINLQDIIYWCGVSAYLFVQIYYTNNGNLRWFDVLGLVFGVIISCLVLKKIRKISRNFLRRYLKKELRNSENADKIENTKNG